MGTIKYVAGRQERETGSHAGWGGGWGCQRLKARNRGKKIQIKRERKERA